MKLLAINGSYRKGKKIETLVERAIEGAMGNAHVSVERLRLIERDIRYRLPWIFIPATGDLYRSN